MDMRERLIGIWLISMTLLSAFAFTVFVISNMDEFILVQVYHTLPVLQIVTLITYLWGPEKLSFKPLKLLYRALYASSLLVIPSFVFIFGGLISQYHTKIPDAINASSMPQEQIVATDQTAVYDTGELYVFFPEYSQIEFVCENRPPQSDESITWCSGAAFHHNSSLSFDQINIEGDHAVQGSFYESPYNNDDFAAFVFSNGQFAFEFDNASQAIRDAANAGGSGFMQIALIANGEIVKQFKGARPRCYRSLAELNGQVCIIDSMEMMTQNEFVEALHQLGVSNALYMDMGAGWNYSWYRNTLNKVVTLFWLPVPWSHNWIVFRR